MSSIIVFKYKAHLLRLINCVKEINVISEFITFAGESFVSKRGMRTSLNMIYRFFGNIARVGKHVAINSVEHIFHQPSVSAGCSSRERVTGGEPSVSSFIVFKCKAQGRTIRGELVHGTECIHPALVSTSPGLSKVSSLNRLRSVFCLLADFIAIESS